MQSIQPSAAEAKVQQKLSPLVPVTLLALITPMFFTLGGLLLTPSRVLFLVVVPILMIRLLNGHYGKLQLLDFGVMASIAWMALAVTIHQPSVLVTFVGSNAAIILGGYLVSRCCIRSLEQFQAMAIWMGVIVILLIPLALVEVTTTQMVIPPILDMIPGVHSHPDVNYRPRFGLDRAQVVFPHPIHFGLFCSLAFTLVFIGLRSRVNAPTRWIWAILIIFAVFMSVSSGPFLATLLPCILLLYEKVAGGIKERWRVLLWGGSILYIAAEVIFPGPFYYRFIETLTFASNTAFVRRILLEYGVAQVMQTPIFGIGFAQWNLPSWMSGSLDNHWLLLALVYGLPASLSLAGGVIGSVVLATRRPFIRGSALWDARLAWVMAVVSISFTMLTVAIWSELQSAVFFLFGAGIWLLDARENSGAEQQSDLEFNDTRQTRIPYSRFGPKATFRSRT